MNLKILLTFLLLSSCATSNNFTRSPEYIKLHGYDHLYPKLIEKLKVNNYPESDGQLFVHKKIKLQNERFCFVGDTGNNSASQKRVSQELQKNCSQIFHMGDLVYPLGIDSEHDPELKEKFINYYSPFKLPFYLTMGNHDYLSSNRSIKPWFKVAKKYKNLHFPHPYFGVNLSGVCIVTIDSTPVELKVAHLVDEQARWLSNIEKNELKSCKIKILFTHYPYRTPYTRRDKKAIRKGWRLKFYEEHIIGKFDLLFSGHDHILSYVGNFSNTDQYISGAGGKLTKKEKIQKFDSPNKKLHGGPGFIKMKFKGETLSSFTIEIIAFEGAHFDKKITVHKKIYNL